MLTSANVAIILSSIIVYFDAGESHDLNQWLVIRLLGNKKKQHVAGWLLFVC